jgi:hypothetical protein
MGLLREEISPAGKLQLFAFNLPVQETYPSSTNCEFQAVITIHPSCCLSKHFLQPAICRNLQEFLFEYGQFAANFFPLSGQEKGRAV